MKPLHWYTTASGNTVLTIIRTRRGDWTTINKSGAVSQIHEDQLTPAAKPPWAPTILKRMGLA